MTLVLDTSILIDIERRKSSTIEELRKLKDAYPLPATITFITRFEFLLGIQERNPQNKEKAIVGLNEFRVLHTTNKTARLLSTLKYKYDQKGIALPLADLLIASLTMEHNQILVTKDHDFKNIEELRTIIIE